MEYIYEVKLDRSRDYSTYYVRAPDIATAAVRAIQVDEQAPAFDPSAPYEGRVTSVLEFCPITQFIDAAK